MKKFRHLVIGGIGSKVLCLVLVTLLVTMTGFTILMIYQSNMLSDLTARASQRQREAITGTTMALMDQVVTESMAHTSVMEARFTDDMFRTTRLRVMLLADYATEVFAHPGNYSPHPYAPPQPGNTGVLIPQMLLAPDTDPSDPQTAAELGLTANMSEMMTSLCAVTDVANAYVGLPCGGFLTVSQNSGEWYLPDGTLKTYDPRTRFWYKQAVEAGDVVFSDVEVDATTGALSIVCAMPVYKPDGSLAAVVGADLYLDDLLSMMSGSEVEGGFRAVVNQDGHVIFTSSREPEFRARISAEAVDLRASENAELAALVTDGLREATPVRLVHLGSGVYYMMGCPLETVNWTLITAFAEEKTGEPAALLEQDYNRIQEEATGTYYEMRNRSRTVATVCTLLLTALMLSGAVVLSRRIVRPLNTITRRIAEVEQDNPEFRMEDAYRTGDEIEVLAQSFADISHKTVQYVSEVRRVTAENERIGTELDLARRIQADILPNIFPAFPERTDLNIYASMHPAKEVGGDFYDFFLIDDDHLGLVVADVSGKGVPAALFMMVSKILVQNYTMSGGSPREVLEKVNQQICQNNREEMFVTVWLGILDLKTGRLTASNAGHEYPILQQPDGRFELVRDKHGFVIGGMEHVRYRDYELQLSRGAKLFVYTDGVPEATNRDGNFFGTERLLEALNRSAGENPTRLVTEVRAAVADFAGDAPQFDDITMLCVEYDGPEIPVREQTFAAQVASIPAVTAFVDGELEAAGCPMRAQAQIDIAIDELFSNIAQYAYCGQAGEATVRVEMEREPRAVQITFIDSGIAYNPLEAPEPDVTLPAEERQIGGLGIFVVRKTMDRVTYERVDGRNILRIWKNL